MEDIVKHEPKGKFSARSSSYMSTKGLPAKSTKFKEHQQKYSTTPIKLGEMEFTNCIIGNDMEILNDFKEACSTNEKYRIASFKTQLTTDPFNIEEIPNPHSDSRTKSIIDCCLTAIGLKLVNDEEEEKDKENNK